MTLADVFNPNIIKVGLESDDKDELFEEMVQVIIDSDSSLSREKLLLALEQREALMSTGIIHDVAVPHGKTDAVKNIVRVFEVFDRGDPAFRELHGLFHKSATAAFSAFQKTFC